MKRILLIGNDVLFMATLETMLETEGFEIVMAHSRKDVETLLAKSAFRCIVSETCVKRTNEFELLHSIHTLQPETPVLIVSDISNTETLAQYYRLGASACFIKPANAMDILEEIRQLIAGREKQAA